MRFALDILKRELARYLSQEVTGRSFLIAGHRGIGKTALVRRAVEELDAEMRRGVLARATPQAAGGSGPAALRRPQRPLLVKVHGPEPPDRRPARRPHRGRRGRLSRPRWRRLAAARHRGQPAGSAPPRDQGAADAPRPEEGRAQGALVQSTIALYRALAGEMAGAFGRLASYLADLQRTSGDSDPRPAELRRRAEEALEVAAQLALDLGGAPDPALLRLYWDRIGLLGAGVVWPGPRGVRAEAGGLGGQGMREIIALATAGQAFQVCSGKVTQSETRKDAATAERALESKGELGREAIRALFGLGAGALVGFGLAGAGAAGPATAASAGVATGLLGTLGFAWSGRRTARRDRGVDLTFLPDRSPQSLERDLPFVVERVREAGLAPVFLVDEMDKVPGTAGVLGDVMQRLKQLTTDHGFFCFLADRDCFEA